MRIIEGATFLNRKETKENSSSCAIVLHNQTWPTRFGRKHPPHIHFYPRPCLIVLQRFGFRSLCCGELKPWYRLMPRYPTFTGICGLVLFHQLWVSQLSVRVFVVSQLKTKNTRTPIGGLVRDYEICTHYVGISPTWTSFPHMGG